VAVGRIAQTWGRRITDSYRYLLGSPLCAADELYDLPAVVLCHDTSPDPRFVYANKAAQVLWERSWDDFIGWPSRLTAPPEHRTSRAQALAAKGVVRGYSGVRVSSSGRLFRIHDATVWTVHDETGGVCGQAATFEQVSPA
jgi:hypothetical protein